MRRVMITGSEGAIGRYVARSLREYYTDLEVTRVVSSKRTMTLPVQKDERVEVIDLRVGSPSRRHYDAVIHLASPPYVPPPAASEDCLRACRDDVTLLGNVLDNLDADHFVLASSALVYGRVDGQALQEHEPATYTPRGPYGLAKLMGERMVRLWTDGQPGRKHTIWRLFNVVSPLEPHDRPGHLHVDLFRKLFIEKWTEIKVGPELRCLVWVGDVADAFVRYLFDDRAACQIFNLAGETSISTQQIAEGLRRFGLDHGLETKTTIQSEPAGPQRPLPSIHQTHARLGWRPATPPWSCLYKFVAGKARYIK